MYLNIIILSAQRNCYGRDFCGRLCARVDIWTAHSQWPALLKDTVTLDACDTDVALIRVVLASRVRASPTLRDTSSKVGQSHQSWTFSDTSCDVRCALRGLCSLLVQTTLIHLLTKFITA